MNESPTLTEGTRPRDPTSAAAPSLRVERVNNAVEEGEEEDERDDVAVKVGGDEGGEALRLAEETVERGD